MKTDYEYIKETTILSWTTHREVARDEDAAYSLLGLFGVNMLMLTAKVSQTQLLAKRSKHSSLHPIRIQNEQEISLGAAGMKCSFHY